VTAPARSPGLVALAAALLAPRADQPACVLVQPPGSDVAQRLAERIGADRIFVHAPSPSPWQPGVIPITLGAEDQDLTAPRPALWPGSLLPARSRRRRIDTLYADRRVGLLILSDPASAAAVLRGAAGIVRDERPGVLLDLRAVSPPIARQTTDAILALLPGYVWAADTGATPLALPSDCVMAGLDPAIHAVGASPGGASSGPQVGRSTGQAKHARDRVDGRVKPGHDAGEVAVLTRPSRSTIRIAFDHALACGGFHPPEPDAPHGGRWTGAGIATWFMLPRPDPGSWTLRLDIADWGNAEAGFSAEIDDRPIPPAAITAETAAYGPFTLDRPCGGVLRVTLFPPRAARDMQRGPRLIGLRILRATLHRAA
jgi:hypothetical protein